MQTNYLLWGVIWLLLAAFFSAFIVFFGRKKFATPRLGFMYIILFFIAGIALLGLSVKLLQ